MFDEDRYWSVHLPNVETLMGPISVNDGVLWNIQLSVTTVRLQIMPDGVRVLSTSARTVLYVIYIYHIYLNVFIYHAEINYVFE